MAEENSLQDLLASLRQSVSRTQSGSHTPAQYSSYAAPVTPTLSSNTIHHQNGSGGSSGRIGNDSSTNLLNLLKFSHQTPQSQEHVASQVYSPSTAEHQHGRGTSASDLVGSYMGNPALQAVKVEHEVPVQPSNPQEFLLQLLNQQAAKSSIIPSVTSSALKPELEDSSSNLGLFSMVPMAHRSLQTEKPTTHTSDDPSLPIHLPSSDKHNDSNLKKQTTPQVKGGLFTYVNPFEQLAASSPRNLKSHSGNGSRVPSRTASLEKYLSMGESATGEGLTGETVDNEGTLKPQRSQGPDDVIETAALEQHTTGSPAKLGSPANDSRTVAEALTQVGESVKREVERVLGGSAGESIGKGVEEGSRTDIKEFSQGQSSEAEVRGESSDKVKGSEIAIEAPIEATDAPKSPKSDASGTTDEERAMMLSSTVAVYNFPIRPFVSIDISTPSPSSVYRFRKEALSEVARVKKDFDQSDRNLVTASHEFISYALPKSGVRIIRQEDAADRKYFDDAHDRIFNTAISFAPPGKSYNSLQAFIATGVSGSVYWTAISNHGEDNIQKSDQQTRGIVFPPFPPIDENTSGGQLKTRAKRSSRHPEFFAIGRGRTIQIVFPLHAQTSQHVDSNGKVHTERYFKNRSLKINTGKAGKDFVFSEDDSVIATLDKTGRLRLWDIRDLTTEEIRNSAQIPQMEVSTPLGTYFTAIPGEKSWPTSLMFVDKARAYLRGIALRYIIVGLRQNHTIQLWDLGLAKAVQELNFPHQSETDAACSISYHAPTGIIVVAHPTRNSIFFVHLSTPKYNLSSMTQARYAQMLANKDAKLPKPDATAIMSGVREYTFPPEKKIRSVDLLPAKSIENESDSTEEPKLFELYVMHSKGVTCIDVKKSDLGWNQESRVINAVEAELTGYIVVRDLRELPVGPTSEVSSSSGDTLVPKAGTAKVSGKENVKPRKDPNSVSHPLEPSHTNGTAHGTGEPSSRKKKSRNRSPTSMTDVPPRAPAPHTPLSMPQELSIHSSTNATATETAHGHRSAPADATDSGPTKETKETKVKRGSADAISLAVSGDFLDKELKKFESTVASQFSMVLKQELESMYHRFDEDKRVQATAANTKQEALLRLVSSSLTENVDKALSHMIIENIQTFVVPAINQVAAATLSEKIPHWIAQNLADKLPLLLNNSVAEAILRPSVLEALSSQVTQQVASAVEARFSHLMLQSITPALQALALSAAQASKDSERRVTEYVRRAEIKHAEDSVKIEQLSTLVRGLSEVVHTMASAQSQFQAEILRSQQKSLEPSHGSSGTSSHSGNVGNVGNSTLGVTAEQRELIEISFLINEGRFEDGTFKWLHSSQREEIFDRVFAKMDPEFLRGCQPLLVLSVGAAISFTFYPNMMERLDWIGKVFELMQINDRETRDVAPRVLQLAADGMERRMRDLSQENGHDLRLARFPPLIQRARQILAILVQG